MYAAEACNITRRSVYCAVRTECLRIIAVCEVIICSALWTSNVCVKQVYSLVKSSLFNSLTVPTVIPLVPFLQICWLLTANKEGTVFEIKKKSALEWLMSSQLPSLVLWTCSMHSQRYRLVAQIVTSTKIRVESLVSGKLLCLEEVNSITPFQVEKKLL
jgi:hypothetical protein